jgi:acyl-CoA dehydrogenase family member 9
VHHACRRVRTGHPPRVLVRNSLWTPASARSRHGAPRTHRDEGFETHPAYETMTQVKPSFIRQLFSGEIDDTQLFPYPALEQAEHERVEALLDRVADYLDEHLDPAIVDEEERIPAEVLNRLGELGLFGAGIPAEHGGMGLSSGAYTRVFEFVTGRDVGLGIVFGVHQSIGIKGVDAGGNGGAEGALPAAKAATGEWMASFALTEPLAGSDVAGIRSRAVEQPDGSYLLSGEKIWIGNGSFSEIVVTFAQVEMEVDGERSGPGDRLRAAAGHGGVPPGRAAAEDGRARAPTSASSASTDVRVPRGERAGASGRRVPAGDAGAELRPHRAGGRRGRRDPADCLRQAADFAAEREQFGSPIASYELVQEKLARMAADAFAAESVAYLTAGLSDRGGVDYALEAAAAKVWCSEALDRAVDESVQIAGGRGYVKGYPYERAYRDARITRIFEGTNEVLRLFIGLSGIEGPGEYLQEIGAALREPIRQLGTLAEFAGERVRLALRRGEPAIDVEVHPRLERHFEYLQEHTRDLRAAAERAIRRHGSAGSSTASWWWRGSPTWRSSYT